MAEAPRSEDVSEPPGSSDAPAVTPAARVGYMLSIPERALRSGTGVVGGILRESAALVVPRSFQNSRTYGVMVQQMLDFLVHDVGGVEQQQGTESSTSGVDNFVARKTVGNFVDMASLATLHISPLLLLAAVSDLAYGSQVYLRELADELKAQGVIAPDSTIDHVNDLLTAVSDASAATSNAFNTPPLSAVALRETIEQTRAAIQSAKGANVIPQAEVRRMWEEIREIAQRENVGILAVSTAATLQAMNKFATLGRGALSTVKVAGSLLDKHVLDHYSQALSEIRSRGLYRSLAEGSRPYTAAVWENFQPRRSTITEGLLSGRLWRAARGAVARWRQRKDSTTPSASDPPPPA
jgi:tryptophan synthase alpha subunit